MTLQIFLPRTGNDYSFFGNRIFQHLVAQSLLELLHGDVEIHNSMPGFFPEAVTSNSSIADFPEDQILVLQHNNPNLSLVAQDFQEGRFRAVEVKTCGLNYEQFSAHRVHLISFLDKLLPEVAVPRLDGSKLLIHMRLGDIASDPAIHPDYFPLPVQFYSNALRKLDKSPAFLGQFDESQYVEELRSTFPDAEYFNLDTLSSFKLLRESKHVMTSVSTFSFLGAWAASSSTRVEHVAAGLFNRQQRPDVNIFPSDDSRYANWEFPAIRRRASEPLGDFLERFQRELASYSSSRFPS